MGAILKLENICKYYYSNNTVSLGLNKINLEFHLGEFVAITGESGSGKTTLLNVIAGLDTYEDGELYYNGENTSHFDENDWEEYRKNKISFIFQNYNLIDSYTVLENVETVLLIQGYSKKEAYKKSLELLETVGILDRKDNRATQLSSGQKQRLAIARALAKNTEIIVADEPTGNLDVENGKAILELLSSLSKDKLILLVTHNYEQAEPYITRKVRLFDGKVKSDYLVNKQNEYIESKEKLVENKASFSNILKMSLMFTKMNIKAQPKKVLSLLTLSLFSCLSIFVCFGLFASYYDENTAKNYDDSAFFNGDKTRLVAIKNENEYFSDSDIEQIYNSSKHIKQVDKYGLADDIYYFTEEDCEEVFNVTTGPGGSASSTLYFKNFTNFVKGESCLLKEDLIAGNLPKDRLEIVVSSNDTSLVGQKQKIYILNGRNWSTYGDATNNYCYDFTISGVVEPKDGSNQIYFDDNFCMCLATSVYSQRNYLQYEYRKVGMGMNNKVQINNVFFVINPELEGNEIMISQATLDSYGLFEDDKIFYPTFQEQSIICINYDSIVIKILEQGHTSCGKVIEVSKEFFDTYYFGDNSDQVSIYIDDYANTTNVIRALNAKGYKTISAYKVSTVEWNERLLITRYLFLGISILVILAVSFLETIIAKALLKFKKNDYIILRSLGMNDKTIKTSIYLELGLYSLLSIIFSILICYILSWCGVTYITDILKFINVTVYLCFILLISLNTFLMGYVFNKYLKKQLTSVISLKED